MGNPQDSDGAIAFRASDMNRMHEAKVESMTRQTLKKTWSYNQPTFQPKRAMTRSLRRKGHASIAQEF